MAGSAEYAERMTLTRRVLLIALLAVALAGTTFAKTKFKSVWKGPDAAGTTFSGRKVAALIIDDRIVSLETLVFSVPKNALLWAGMSETENPKTAAAVVAEVVKEAAKEMEKQGLARRR
jgi:hypothetical protein